MTSAPSRGETDDQSLSLRSATALQLQTFRVICQPQAVEEDVIQRTSFSGASVRLTCGRHRRPPRDHAGCRLSLHDRAGRSRHERRVATRRPGGRGRCRMGPARGAASSAGPLNDDQYRHRRIHDEPPWPGPPRSSRRRRGRESRWPGPARRRFCRRTAGRRCCRAAS